MTAVFGEVRDGETGGWLGERKVAGAAEFPDEVKARLDEKCCGVKLAKAGEEVE